MANYSQLTKNKQEGALKETLVLAQPEQPPGSVTWEGEKPAELTEASGAKKETSSEGAVQKPVTGQPAAAAGTSAVHWSDQEFKKIEDILVEDLADVYLGLDAARRRLFKEEGERAASQIRTLLAKAEITVKKVLDIIKRWLLLIPHVNKFFLEQEAKIKTDKIMKLTREKDK